MKTTAREMPTHYVIHTVTIEVGGLPAAEIITWATGSTLRKGQ